RETGLAGRWFFLSVNEYSGSEKGVLVTDRTDQMLQFVEAAEHFFARPVQRVSAPGGPARSSFRVHFSDLSVIATRRANIHRARLEAFALKRLSARCDLVPRCLGFVGGIMFQTDVGQQRLNQAIAQANQTQQLDLAAEAVATIFRIQSEARQTDLGAVMPRLGTSRDWNLALVQSVRVLNTISESDPVAIDQVRAYEKLAVIGTQFVKWDCRSGNAAVDGNGQLRWFDFEFCGLRHGAEDLAWLIGDEAWPLAPEAMIDIVIDAYDRGTGHPLTEYLEYLAVFLTFHCSQRLQLILREARQQGWLSKGHVLELDDTGAHPEFAAQLCRVGRYFAAQTRLTAPLARHFDEAHLFFSGLTAEGRSLPSV
ncbi:MAG: hypothetical protein AAF408_12485, partial [Pseudomonadota bacterium]